MTSASLTELHLLRASERSRDKTESHQPSLWFHSVVLEQHDGLAAVIKLLLLLLPVKDMKKSLNMSVCQDCSLDSDFL